MNKKIIVPVVLLLVLLILIQTVVIHNVYTTRVLGGNDFYPRWAGLKALLLEGRDPYDPSVTEEIAAVLDPLQRRQNSFSFAYPLHIIFVMGPLAYLSYDWAIAAWMVLVQWATIGTVAVLLAKQKWQLSPLALAAILLATIAFYPVARSIMLGQFTMHVAFFLALTLWAIHRGADGWAGVFFSATSIKPQMVFFIGPWLLLWTLRQRRYRFIWGIIGGGLGLLVASMVFFPRWPMSFLEDLRRYAAIAGGKEPLAILSELIVGGNAAWLQYSMAAFLIGGMLYAWWQGWRGEMDFENVLYWSIVANLLVPFQTGTTNQVLLLFPFFAWTQELKQRWHPLLTAFLIVVLHTAIWLFFLNTISGDYENPLLFLPLPLLTLLALIARQVSAQRRSEGELRAGQTSS